MADSETGEVGIRLGPALLPLTILIASARMRNPKRTQGRQKAGDPRDVAVSVLGALERTHMPVQAVLDAELKRAELTGPDAALCAEFCYGVLRSEIRLRFVAERFFKDFTALPTHMRHILFTAVYALLFSDALPEYAVVDRAVEAVKRDYGGVLARVANGGLRALCREGDAPRRPDYYRQELADVFAASMVYYSLPSWLGEFWSRAYGPETALRLAAKSAARPPAGLRLNLRRAFCEQTAMLLEKAGARRFGPSGFLFEGERSRAAAQISLPNLLAEGLLSRQGPGSQAALAALSPENWPEPIWDACAGQGSKTCALLEQKKALVAASDIRLSRLHRCAEECRRLDLPAPLFVLASLFASPLRKRPGTILVDAPCSGLGVLASRPDIRRRRTPADIEDFIRIQENMLDAAYDFLPSGGKLAYITCTVNPDENERQISRLCSRRAGAVTEREWSTPLEEPFFEGMYAALVAKA